MLHIPRLAPAYRHWCCTAGAAAPCIKARDDPCASLRGPTYPDPGPAPGAPRAPVRGRGEHSRSGPPRTGAADVDGPELNERNVVSLPIQILDAPAPPPLPPPPRPAPPPTVPILAHDPAPVAATPTVPAYAPTQSPAPPRPLKDEFKTLPGSPPERVRELAWRTAHRFGDQTSIGFYIMVLTLVSTGAAPVDRLLAAYGAGEKSIGKAMRSGAIFCSVWSGWRPPILPSSIQPHYRQADSGRNPITLCPTNSGLGFSPAKPFPDRGRVDDIKPAVALLDGIPTTPACPVLSVPEALTCQQPVAGVSDLAMATISREEEIAELRDFAGPQEPVPSHRAYETSGAWRIGRVGERSSRAYGGCWGWGWSNHRPAPPRPAQGPCQQGTGQGGGVCPVPTGARSVIRCARAVARSRCCAAGCLHPDASGAAHTVLRGRPGGQAFR